MNFLFRLISSTGAIMLVCYMLPGVDLDNPVYALILAFVFAILNTFLKPLLILLTLPITILTFGLFLLVINALIVLLADAMFSWFRVDGFWWALLFSLITSLLVSVLEGMRKQEER